MNKLEKHGLTTAATRFRQLSVQKDNAAMTLKEWGVKYFSHFFFRDFSPLHETLASEYERITLQRGVHLNIVAPRGNAKTTWAQIKIIKSICEATEHYILIISDTGVQAANILDTIKMELESNEALRRDYPLPTSTGAVWNNLRVETANGICIEALGTGQKIRGKKFKQYRPSLIILDDPDNDEDVRSPTTRLQHIEWFNKALLKCGDTDTNIVVVGTMLHRECIVGHLEKRPDFITIKFQSIMSWPTNMALWSEWETLYWSSAVTLKGGKSERKTTEADLFYELNYDAMNAGAEVLWAPLEDLITLMKMRAASGHAAFQSEKQNDPRDPTKCEFPEEWFDESIEYDYEDLIKRLSNEEHVTVVYADPAKGGETKKHDYSPIVTLHYFGDMHAYIEIDMRKIPVTMLTDRCIELHKVMRSSVLGFESNGFQELIGDEIFFKAQKAGVFNINIVPVENYGVHKLIRISRLGVWLEKKFFKFRKNCPYTALLLQQLKDHPEPDHDDGSDALEGAMRLLTQVTSGQDGFKEETDHLPANIR
jgi:hypothetical protein